MLYILYGEDDYTRRQALHKFLRGDSGSSAGENDITYLDGATVNASEFRAASLTVPFLSSRRFVVVNGLMNRFEPKEKLAASKKSAKNTGDVNDWRAFSQIIDELPPTTELIFVDNQISNKNNLFSAIMDKAKVMVFNPVKTRELPDWVRQKVIEADGKISTQASDYLAKLIGNDLWTLSNEIDKLLAYVGDRMIDERDIKAIVTHAVETNIFSLMDAVMEGKTNAAQELLSQALRGGMSPGYILTMLARQLRLAVLTKELKAMNKSRTEIQEQLSLAEFAFQKTEAQSEKYTFNQLREFYTKLLETDLYIKTGQYDEELALTLLVAEMSRF